MLIGQGFVPENDVYFAFGGDEEIFGGDAPAIVEELKKRGIEFVVASGNQYYQLISFFPELKDEISFGAENGALVYEHGKQLFHADCYWRVAKR